MTPDQVDELTRLSRKMVETEDNPQRSVDGGAHLLSVIRNDILDLCGQVGRDEVNSGRPANTKKRKVGA